MSLYTWNQLPVDQLNPLATRQMIHGANVTLAKLFLKKGFIVPTHSHVNEQITTILEGAMLFTMPDGQVMVRAGDSFAIPPNVPHSAETLEDCVALDIFVPIREDWLRGDDAYLRK